MFDLDGEIRAWARAVHPDGCGRDGSVDELMDHLSSEIERLQHEGLSQEQAFVAATERMGSVDELMREHAKNRRVVSMLCRAPQDEDAGEPQRRRDPMNPRRAAVLNLVVAIVFAAAILMSAFLLPDEEASATVTYLLIAVWLIPFTLLSASAGRRSIRSEYRCIRRKVAGLIGRG